MNVLAKAQSLYDAWVKVTGAPPPSKNAVILALAQATHENHCGDDWPNSHNWGCCDLRGTTAMEQRALTQGILHTGMWLLADGTWSVTPSSLAVGFLHADSTPTPTGPRWYSVWFAAFPDDVKGASYFLKVVLRMLLESVNDPSLTAESYATSCYLHGYYEGVHAGARPVGQRAVPLNPGELANIRDYSGAMELLVPGITKALAGWEPEFSGG